MLPSLAVAFLLGLVCGSYLPFFPLSICLFLVGLAVGAGLLERAGLIEPRRATVLYGSLLAGVLYWVAATPFSQSEPLPRDPLISPRTMVIGRIMAPVQHGPGRQTLLVRLEEPESGARIVRLVWREPGEAVRYGDLISFRAKLRRPTGLLNPGGFDYAAYLKHQGIDVTASVNGVEAVQVLEPGAETWRWFAGNRIDRWRSTIRQAAVTSLAQPALGIFLGIIIGERGYLEQDLQEWFMTTGTVHLLSISGSHLGLVALVVFWVVKQGVKRLPLAPLLHLSRVITPSRTAILVTWPIVALYAWLAGAELATIRSLVMITLGMIALWLGYERRLYHAVAAAALLIVLHNPHAIYDISFQLSFASVLMIVQLLSWLESKPENEADGSLTLMRQAVRYGRDALLTSTAVTVGTAPLVALYFNQIPWMGIATNLVAVPFTGGLLVPLGLLAAAWTVVADAGGLVMGTVLEPLLDGLAQALRWCAGIPGGAWHIAAPSMVSMIVFYAALASAVARSMSRSLRFMAATLVVLTIGWWGLSPRLGLDGDRWRVTFLDVGQGDSAVIELPDGRTVLIDGGVRYERFDMGRAVVAPFLWNRGIDHIDHVVATHQQLDHVGGLIWVLRHMPVGRYWHNGTERSEQFVADLTAVLDAKRIPKSLAARGQDLVRSGSCALTALNPSYATPNHGVQETGTIRRDGTFLNNQSIVLRLKCGEQSLLFAADLERAGIRRLGEEGRQPVTVVKVPHHGARSSLDRDWIRQIQPRYAVISAGRGNVYGHPVADVLQAYADVQASVLRTDRDGAIWIEGRLSSSDLTVIRMRDRLIEPLSWRHCLLECERENWRRAWMQWRDRWD
ncbi:DNA internalization-related competence protein ComEC/Rec2 [Candidatus Nitrospira inopinata]|jgi:competence protein ComEC|uniref:Putative Competence protein ComEC/Rec2 related protein n=1 Tax=Candidatus Nitrospira inopinata TaxID=1715989 RepID=A0A0S4KTT9_9BACT|nr:DNA internalization-related competence protein ComEC/Rec2 [Candidatus Nitrospira inopinata]CUQ67461.1 putative Competence protein ComEC/Rec2 related protein [Candidatus Nitrospira inopinata]